MGSGVRGGGGGGRGGGAVVCDCGTPWTFLLTFLPKIHKDKEITNQFKNTNAPYVEVEDVRDLKLRPFVAGPSCLTHVK